MRRRREFSFNGDEKVMKKEEIKEKESIVVCVCVCVCPQSAVALKI